MEPQIQYTQTSDGVNIAYFAIGAGPPMIAMSAHLGITIAREWDIPAFRRLAELTSLAFSYIRYDPHGSGLSDRNDADLSVESYVRDLEAVVDAATTAPFVLFANGVMTTPALVYAARHPDRLTHLVLWRVAANSGDYKSPLHDQLMRMALTDWRLACESFCRAVDNWEHEEENAPMAAMMRDSVTPETWMKFETERRATWDVREYLPRIATPTLVIHPRNHPYYDQEPAKRVAAAIPGARLALVDSATVLLSESKVAAVVGEFLLGATRARPSAEHGRPSGTSIILFADIVDSTATTERIGDAAFRERARSLDDRLRAIIRGRGGAPIDGKLLGDGVLATFQSASDAIAAALAFGAAAASSDLQLHVGLHAGDVIREAGNVFGGAVNIASRISSLSAAGEVLVSATVRELARTSARVDFEDRGEQEMKGVGEPVRVYAVRAEE